MLISVLALLAGLVLLVVSADRAVEHAEAASEHLGVSPVIVGALVVGLGTSLPEMVVSGVSAAQRDTIDLAVGNLIGSNAANLTLVLGTGSIIVAVRARRHVFRREGALMLTATLLDSGFLVDERLERWEGGILLIAMVGAAWVIAFGVNGDDDRDQVIGDPAIVRTAVVWAIAALAGVVIGAQLLVTGAVDVADALGASEAFIGLTIVAIGTSLPELATTVACARRGAVELIVGNLFGSNIFNSLAVAGVAAVVGTGRLDDSPSLSIQIMVVVTLLALGTGAHKEHFSRLDGIVLLAAYPAILLAGL